ncbi:hypothetical protein J7L13_03390 [bacterium]|nr:hypothetical protein [bacterium]
MNDREKYLRWLRTRLKRIRRVKRKRRIVPEQVSEEEEIPEEDWEERPEEGKEEEEEKGPKRRERRPEKREEKGKKPEEGKESSEAGKEPTERKPSTPEEGLSRPKGAPRGGVGEAGIEAGETASAGMEAAGAGAEAAGAEAAGAGMAAGAGAEAAAATAAVETAAVAGTAGAAATAPAWVPVVIIVVAVILIIITIVLIVALVLAIFKFAGRSAPSYPDMSNPADRAAVGRVLAASSVRDASLLASSAGKKAEERITKITSELNCQNRDKKCQEAKKQLQRLRTNIKALAESPPIDKDYAKYKIQETTKLLKTISKSNVFTEKEKKTLNELKNEWSEIAKDANQILSLRSPILYMNSFDLAMIKQGKADRRIIAVLNKLIDFSLTQKSPRWSMFKIGRVFKASPYAKREVPLKESKKYISAHHFGQAIDITVVGKYRCTVKKFSGKKTFWLPCYVYYQGGGPQYPGIGKSLNYAEFFVLYGLSGMQFELGPVDLERSRSFWESFSELGEQTLREELGIPPELWYQRVPFIPEKILAAYLAQETNLPPQAILEALLYKDEEALIKGIISAKLDLPLGALEGRSWNERFINIYQAYVRRTLGLEGTDLKDFSSSKELGKAILQKYFTISEWDDVEKNKIFNTISLSKTYYQNAWHLPKEELEKLIAQENIEALAERIGEQFQKDFIKKGANSYLIRWLGLPSGKTTEPEYQIAAGRYILARILYLPNPYKAYTDPSYFFKEAPFSPSANIDLCLSFSQGQTCPLYLFFTNPETFIDRLRKAVSPLISRRTEFGEELGSALKNTLHTSTLEVKRLPEIWKDKEKRKELSSELNDFAAQMLQDNLKLRSELPGIFFQIQQGNWGFALKLLGLNKISEELAFPPDVIEKLTLPNAEPKKIIRELAAFKALESLGVNPWLIDYSILPEDWFESPEKFASVATALWLKNRGVDFITIDEKGKLKFEIQSLPEAIDILAGDAPEDVYPSPLASFLGISTEELALLAKLAKNGSLSEISEAEIELLKTIERNLHLPEGLGLDLLSGKISFSHWAEKAWEKEAFRIWTQNKAKDVFGLPEGVKINPASFLEGIVNHDQEKMTSFLLSLGYAQLSKTFNIPLPQIKKFFDFNSLSGEIKELREIGLRYLAAKIAPDVKTFNTLLSLYKSYFEGNPKIPDSVVIKKLNKVLARSLNVPGEETQPFLANHLERAFTTYSVAQLAKLNRAVLKDKGMTYREIKQVFLGDQTKPKPSTISLSEIARYHEQQKALKKERLKDLTYALVDINLIQKDKTVPAGFTKALIEGSKEEKARMIAYWLTNKAKLPEEFAPLFNKLIIDEDITKIGWDDLFTYIPDLAKYSGQLQALKTLWDNLENLKNLRNIESLDNVLKTTEIVKVLIGEETKIPLAEAGNFIRAIDQLENLDLSQIGRELEPTQVFLGILQNFDLPGVEIAGIEVNLGDALLVLAGANPVNLFVGKIAGKVLGKVLGLFGFGKVKCENPRLTAQKQIRTTVKQILETKPYPPTQIIVLRRQDVYYFSGLTDEGKVSKNRKDILTEKYGPPQNRGQKGMLTSPLMWDHIHVGY